MKNERYHGPLIQDGAHFGYIRLFPWITLFISSLLLWGNSFIDKVGVFKVIFLICVSISLFCILWSFSQHLFYHFQTFTYILIALIVLVIIIDFSFIGLLMCVGNGGIYSLISAIYNIIMLLLFLTSCGVYSWYYLPKNQGKVWKWNQWETYDIKTKDKKGDWRRNFGVAFGAVMFLSSLLTGTLENVFGVFLGALITGTLSAVFVDALYAAVYVRKNPEEL